MSFGSRALALCLLVASVAAPRHARAFFGLYVAGPGSQVFNPATTVVMMREGTRTVVSMQPSCQGPPESFAMIVPVPVVLQKENVRTLPREVFERIDLMSAPRLVETWEQDPCGPLRDATNAPPASAGTVRGGFDPKSPPSDFGVKVEAQLTAGEYEIAILSASDSATLDAWLRRESFVVPEGAQPLIEQYVQAGSKLFVAKVDAKKVRVENGRAILSPLRFHYDSETFTLPVRLGLVSSPGTQDLVVHILARDQRFEVANRPNVTIPTNLDVNESARDRFGQLYAALFDETLAKNSGAVVTEYAWTAEACDPCPGPALRPEELVILGADVLPSTADAPRAATVTGMPPRGMPTPAQHLFWRLRASAQVCAGMSKPKAWGDEGTIEAKLSEKGVSIVKVTGLPAEMKTCIEQQAKMIKPSVQIAPFGAEASVTIEWVASPPNLWDFVLTRLHARFGKGAPVEDFVFRPAPPIAGGREVRDAEGKLEAGASPGPANAFQARYVIRHPWTGPIECKHPRRGIWGGPPGGDPKEMRPKAARDVAFAPRTGAQVASFLTGPPPVVETNPTVPAPPRAQDECGCRAIGDSAGSNRVAGWAWIAALVTAVARAVRRRGGASGGRRESGWPLPWR